MPPRTNRHPSGTPKRFSSARLRAWYESRRKGDPTLTLERIAVACGVTKEAVRKWMSGGSPKATALYALIAFVESLGEDDSVFTE